MAAHPTDPEHHDRPGGHQRRHLPALQRYTITMAFRTACFILAVTVAHGWLSGSCSPVRCSCRTWACCWPTRPTRPVGRSRPVQGAPDDARQLTAGPEPEYVEGVVIAEDDDDRYAGTARG